MRDRADRKLTMTADLLTRNAPVWESHPWFLELYAKLLDNPGSAEGSIVVRLQMAGDAIEAGWELPAVSDPAYVQGYLDQPKPESREVVFQALDTAVTPPVIDNWNQLTDIVGKELEAAKLGQKTPQQALTDAAAAVKGIL